MIMNLENDEYMLRRTYTESDSIEFAQEIGLLMREKICCGRRCSLVQRTKSKNNGFYFRCNTKSCRKEYSLKKNSFFEHSHLSIKQIVRLLFYFCKGETQFERLKEKINISTNKTLTDWLKFAREICIQYYENHPVILGGVGRIVELDEALLVRRKYNQGRMVREQWIFGGYDVLLKKSFIVAVPNRRRETLFPIIRRFVLPGSIVVTDSAIVYNSINDLGMLHYKVNHKIGEFVSREHGFTTNHVESLWSRCKRIHKFRNGTHRTTLDSHLFEFMWREQFKNSFESLIQHIIEIYQDN